MCNFFFRNSGDFFLSYPICRKSLTIMTSRYRVEYALKSHRRDEFIEWIKGLLAVPFVLHSRHNKFDFKVNHIDEDSLLEQEERCTQEVNRRYLEIFDDIEQLIEGSRKLSGLEGNSKDTSRLNQLVPTVGNFFTELPLRDAFMIEDSRRCISRRILVSPSFNDIRLCLNTAQILALSRHSKNEHSTHNLKLITFDGDLTLYDDSESIISGSPVTERIMTLLEMDFFVGVVTAAGYPGQGGASQYYNRLKGLIDEISRSASLTAGQKENFLVMGGESNYLFRYRNALGNLEYVNGDEWYLPIMQQWDKKQVDTLVDKAEKHLKFLRRLLKLDDYSKTSIIRKERSVGIVPVKGYEILRENLEEIVLSCSIELSEVVDKLPLPSDPHEKIRFCAFNGGWDVWIDIGDKSLGIAALQKYLCRDRHDHRCPIRNSETLHVGDQFASVGANDFRARLSACTVWISNPKETVALLDDLLYYLMN